VLQAARTAREEGVDERREANVSPVKKKTAKKATVKRARPNKRGAIVKKAPKKRTTIKKATTGLRARPTKRTSAKKAVKTTSRARPNKR
jgi:hypothetical protein